MENAHVYHPFTRTDLVMEVKINSMGLREREITPEFFSPEVYRILAIGDSGTFGFGVNMEERFSTRLEVLLRQAGYPGHGIHGRSSARKTGRSGLQRALREKLFAPAILLHLRGGLSWGVTPEGKRAFCRWCP